MFKKPLTDYFPAADLPIASIGNESPGTTFLREVVELCDSVNHCLRSFSRKKNGALTKDSADSYSRIANSTFALVMSHFETFQRRQFSDLIEWRFMYECHSESDLARALEKIGCRVTILRTLAGGNAYGDADSGDVIADSMPGWHDPSRVNTYFRAVLPTHCFYSDSACKELRLLWQLRHSIVHCGSVITPGDALKVRALSRYRSRVLQFDEKFFSVLGRRLHILTQAILDPLISHIEPLLIKDDLDTDEDIEHILGLIAGYESPRISWFR